RDREPDAAAGALDAAGERPGGRIAAALAERRSDPYEPGAAPRAQLLRRLAAPETRARKNQIEKPHLRTLVRRRAPDRVNSATKACTRHAAAARLAPATGCRPRAAPPGCRCRATRRRTGSRTRARGCAARRRTGRADR